MGIREQGGVLLASVQNTIDMSKTIAENGILVVTAAIFLIVAFYILKRMISSYTNLIDEIIPKVEEVTKSVDNLKASVNEMMSAHNAHTNQSLRSIEKDSKEISESVNQCHKNLTELGSSIKSLQNNYDTLLKLVVGINGVNNILGGRTDNSMYYNGNTNNYRELIYDRDDTNNYNKKEEEES